MIIQRFIERLTLPKETKVVIKSVKQLINTDEHKNRKYLELYHSIHTYSITESLKVVDSIMKTGFRESIYGNKGKETYLSSHSSYGLRWIGAGSGMLICFVRTDEPKKIKRFLSEIPPGYEYVVKPELIIPAYFIDYEIIGKSGNQGWRKEGETGCVSCDKERIRCDCPIEPAIYPDENIIYLKN